jgi:hypothetical protein
MGFHHPPSPSTHAFFVPFLTTPDRKKTNKQNPNLSNFLSLLLYDSNKWDHKLHGNKLQTAWRIRKP